MSRTSHSRMVRWTVRGSLRASVTRTGARLVDDLGGEAVGPGDQLPDALVDVGRPAVADLPVEEAVVAPDVGREAVDVEQLADAPADQPEQLLELLGVGDPGGLHGDLLEGAAGSPVTGRAVLPGGPAPALLTDRSPCGFLQKASGCLRGDLSPRCAYNPPGGRVGSLLEQAGDVVASRRA